jgi:TolA-binding protein
MVSTGRKRLRLALMFSAVLLALSLGSCLSFAEEGGDSINARLSRVEQKLAELQALVGALQSFTHANPAPMPAEDTNGGVPEPPLSQRDLGTRVSALETQIGALTAELEQINQRLNALNAAPAAQAPLPLAPSSPPPDRQGDARPPPDQAMAAMAASAGDAGDSNDTSKPRWYGPRPGEDQTSALPPWAPQPLSPPTASDGQPQRLMAALPGDDAHSLNEKGHGALTQNDYAGAEVAFRQLIESTPRIRSRRMRNIGSARASTAAANTRLPPTPSSRATRNTNLATRRRRHCSSSACPLPPLARRMPPARLSASSRPNSRKRRRPSATR